MKKRSSTRPQPDLVFFTDRDLGKLVPATLRAAGFEVERHDDHYGPNTPDTEWLAEAGARGWVALTHNKNIRYVTLEKEMVARAGVRLFVLIGAYTHRELADNLVATMPRVVQFLDDHKPPFIAKIYMASQGDREAGRPGRVEWWWPPR